MNALELADWFDGRILYLWDAEDGQYYDSAIASEIVPTLRQQQVRLENMWRANTVLQAEIEALKSVVYWLKENRPEVWEDIKSWERKAEK